MTTLMFDLIAELVDCAVVGCVYSRFDDKSFI